jgi:hypothetical protein
VRKSPKEPLANTKKSGTGPDFLCGEFFVKNISKEIGRYIDYLT